MAKHSDRGNGRNFEIKNCLTFLFVPDGSSQQHHILASRKLIFQMIRLFTEYFRADSRIL
jgi:hypothetical protein